MSDEQELLPVTQADFAPCPTCKQYSHSIGEDRVAEAFLHFQSMIAHPVRGHPMGHAFDDKTRDLAQVLVAAARAAIAAMPSRNDGLEEAARVADAQVAIYEAKKDAASKADMDERWERMENYRDAAEYIAAAIRSKKDQADDLRG